MRFASRRCNLLSDESGNVLILVALSMTALMGFTALAVDVGLLFRATRNLQIVAASTAGALDYHNTNPSAGVQTTAQNTATADGVTNEGEWGHCHGKQSSAHTGPAYRSGHDAPVVDLI